MDAKTYIPAYISPHSFFLFVYILINFIVYFCATSAPRARKMITLRCNQLFGSKPM